MPDREKVINGLEHCTKESEHICDNPCRGCTYESTESGVNSKCIDELMSDALALLKEQENREQNICKEICDFIMGACSTDTEDDKDFICYEIQKCFSHFCADGEMKTD